MTAGILPLLLHFALGLAAGFAVGLLHFRLLWWNTQMLLGSGSAVAAIAVVVLRFAVLIGAFVLLAQFGALALLAGAVGVLAARQVAVRRYGGAA
ncbi:ATP synthase subunit I [Rhodobium gokarnense]|uniref:F1F0 ATPase subunit 2 n=1 Tax=Rhodobium gokarnense TaxID=364296 RepID=A0ABT3H6E1_9HYPH|nr:ATP synthase subunit I [Rhodobium gokarnense]MCW2305909.1 F1F0 ATPase subunit 2 [Rhodobium gokarnense]